MRCVKSISMKHTYLRISHFIFYGKTNIYAFGMLQKKVTINIITGHKSHFK